MAQLQVLTEEEKTLPIRELISILLLILGSIVLSIGAFIELGLGFGLIVVGAMFLILAIIFGWKR